MKTYNEIMDNIDSQIINGMQTEIKELLHNIAQKRAANPQPRTSCEKIFGISEEHLKYVEYDKDGNIIKFIAQNHARDFKR
jgi:hypothetical protein